jgi:hypothetical protein
MKKVLLAVSVFMLFLFVAVPAMAVPITFNFYGEIGGNFDDAVGFDGTYAITAIADTSSLAAGTLIDGSPVLYYANPFVSGSLRLSGSTYDLLNNNADLGKISNTFAIASPLYVALSQVDGALGFGVWDPAMINDPLESPFTGDVVTAWGLSNAYDMISSFGPITTLDFLAGGALLLASGETFNFELAPEGSTLTYSANVPETSMFLLFGAGLAGLGLLRKKVS